MAKNIFLMGILIAIVLSIPVTPFSQEDLIVQVSINTFKSQVRLPPEAEIKFLEKKDSPVPDFYAVKLLIVLPDKEMPVMVYVDKTGEKVIIGNLIIKGENVTIKEAGPPRRKKIDMGILEIEKSPFMGDRNSKVTIVEFSSFQCPYCRDSWVNLQKLIQKHPHEIRYIFKHFPSQPQGKKFELSELAAATQEVSNEAFWLIHDFFFTEEGQNVMRLEKEVIKQKIEQLLQIKGYDVRVFQSALETGKAKKRVLDDMAVGNRIRITGTPTKIVNGDMIIGSSQDNTLERYLRK